MTGGMHWENVTPSILNSTQNLTSVDALNDDFNDTCTAISPGGILISEVCPKQEFGMEVVIKGALDGESCESFYAIVQYRSNDPMNNKTISTSGRPNLCRVMSVFSNDNGYSSYSLVCVCREVLCNEVLLWIPGALENDVEFCYTDVDCN